jgi:hypothetical protein
MEVNTEERMNEIKKLEPFEDLGMNRELGREGEVGDVLVNEFNLTALWQKQCEVIDAVNEIIRQVVDGDDIIEMITPRRSLADVLADRPPLNACGVIFTENGQAFRCSRTRPCPDNPAVGLGCGA